MDSERIGRRTTVLLTIAAVNAAPVVAYALGATVYLLLIHRSQGGEDLTGLTVFILGGLIVVATAVSTVIGLAIALVRFRRRPGWLAPPLSTRGAVAAGARTAAWGLLALVPPAILALAGWVAVALNTG